MADLKPNQIEKALTTLVEMKDKLKDAKIVLKEYKIQSERLSQLKKAKKELGADIEAEVKRIEDEYLVDGDYEEAKNEELTLKNQIREKNAELRAMMAQVNPSQLLATYDYNIKGEALKMQVERVVKVYINGKEER